MKMGVFSDYPAADKLGALGISNYFDIALSAQDDAIRAFKPNPAGICRVVEHLGVAPRQTLYIGDRPDVDAIAAEAAGVQCAIISRRSKKDCADARYAVISSYHQLRELLFR